MLVVIQEEETVSQLPTSEKFLQKSVNGVRPGSVFGRPVSFSSRDKADLTDPINSFYNEFVFMGILLRYQEWLL
jgi:hypothetical protein